MLVYYFDENTQQVEEISVKKVVIGIELATLFSDVYHFKTINLNKLLYIVE